MGVKKAIKKWRDDYVKRQVAGVRLPIFVPSAVVRQEIIFSGRVQKVGFRLEVQELAVRLGLTGFCENLETGEVRTVLQGEENRIRYLVWFMKSLKRIRVDKAVIQELPLKAGEEGFSRR